MKRLWGHGAAELRGSAFGVPATLFLLVFSAFPLLQMLAMAFSDVGFGNVIRGEWPLVGFDNFNTLLKGPTFLEALTNTLTFVAIVVVLSIVGGMGVAILIRKATRTGRITQAILVFAWTLPPVVSGSAWKFLLFSNGVVNQLLGRTDDAILWLADPGIALFSVATVNAWAALPFAALVLKAGLLGLSRETEEAAAVDGATTWQTFWRINLPQLRPVILVLAVLLIVYAFRSFDYIIVMTQGGPGTASATLPYLGYVLSFRLGFFGRGAAAALVAGLFVAVLAWAYVRLTRREVAPS